MKGYATEIEKETLDNSNFRKVLFTGRYLQLVVMSLEPNEDIGEEVHENVDQFFRIEQGKAKFVIDGEETIVKEDEVFIVPAGSRHNVINASPDADLKLYTIYSPPNHPDGTVHKDRQETEDYEKAHHAV